MELFEREIKVSQMRRGAMTPEEKKWIEDVILRKDLWSDKVFVEDLGLGPSREVVMKYWLDVDIPMALKIIERQADALQKLDADYRELAWKVTVLSKAVLDKHLDSIPIQNMGEG